MKAREDADVASESLSLEVFALPLAAAVASVAPVASAALASSAGAAADAAAAAFCAASAWDWASAWRKVVGGVLPCAFVAPFALAALPAAAPAASALVVPVCDAPRFERELEPDFALEEAAPDP